MPVTLPSSNHSARRIPTAARRWAAGYLLLVLAAWACEAVLGERMWAAAVLTYVPQWPFAVPVAGLLVWAAAGHDGRAVLLSGASALVVLFPLMNLAPRLRADGRRGDVRLMTFNIHGGLQGADRVASAIRAADPDIACLQEAQAELGSEDPLPAIRAALPGYSFHRSGGVVLCSRLPVRSVVARRFRSRGVWRRALDATVLLGDRPIRVIGAHFVTNRSHFERGPAAHWREAAGVRLDQATELAGWVRESPLPTLVAGDLNTPARGIAFRRLEAVAAGAFSSAGAGFGYTYPAARPVLRIDHVFSANGMRATSARVGPPGASDHRPLICDFSVGPDRQ